MAKAKAVVSKRWYESITLWANIIMILGIALQAYEGTTVMDAQLQAGIVAVVNAVLRLRTGKPIALGKVAG